MQSPLNTSDCFSLNRVAKHLGVHLATVYRWTSKGVRGRRLRSYLVGGRRFVSRVDLDLFLQPSEAPAMPGLEHRKDLAQAKLKSLGVDRKAL
jgi:excisionase family DNA binding protein